MDVLGFRNEAVHRPYATVISWLEFAELVSFIAPCSAAGACAAVPIVRSISHLAANRALLAALFRFNRFSGRKHPSVLLVAIFAAACTGAPVPLMAGNLACETQSERPFSNVRLYRFKFTIERGRRTWSWRPAAATIPLPVDAFPAIRLAARRYNRKRHILRPKGEGVCRIWSSF